MKRELSLWERLTSFENLLWAAEKARRGKRGRTNVARFEFDLENELVRLQDELRAKSYRPGEYRTFYIHDPKRRLISAAPYRDRVVHHALCGVLEPIFESTFIFDSYACRRGKGTHAAADRFTDFARQYAYVLQSDIAKFFPSVDHEILKALIACKIQDRDVLWLAGHIIDCSNPQEPVCDWFFGDDLFAPAHRRRGLPIGNQTSQFFGNVYLDPFDHFVREQLQPPGYIRYVDDFVLFANDKGWLAEAREACRDFLRGLRLKMHPRKCVVLRVRDGARFLGYRIFPTHRLLPKSNVRRFRRRLQALQVRYQAGQVTPPEIRRRIVGWIGHAIHADTFRLRERLFDRVSFTRTVEDLAVSGDGR